MENKTVQTVEFNANHDYTKWKTKQSEDIGAQASNAVFFFHEITEARLSPLKIVRSCHPTYEF